ncbi:MAG: type I-C CRISPR-associated protein Cas8c/Csd1 [Bacteroidota bacterium]
MIQELVGLGHRIRDLQPTSSRSHDALDNVPVSIDCIIDDQGNFKQFIPHESQMTVGERISAKKGKARLLVDRAEEVLEIVDEREKNRDLREKLNKQARFKHSLFREKLRLYSQLKELMPVNKFYESNRVNGVQKARAAFSKLEDKEWQGNIAFLIAGESKRLHEKDRVLEAIIERYQRSMTKIRRPRFARCSVCGTTSQAIADIPHGMIKRVPDGKASGCALVSYNDSAFESYGLKGNENSSICTRCAKAYVDALNWLLSNGSLVSGEKGKKSYRYTNRKNISPDTSIVFWLRDTVQYDLLAILDNPTEQSVHALFDSVFKGTEPSKFESDTFYALTLSGAAARIAVRDWIETSLDTLRRNLAQWFQDVAVGGFDSDKRGLIIGFPRYSSLIWNIKGKSENDVQHGRIGTVLWKSAVMGHAPPLWVLSSVLGRIRAEQGHVTTERVAVLKLCLNRRPNQQQGAKHMATLDDSNGDIAYTCGRLFSVLESIQYHALGGDVNAGIRERFFSFASTMPSTAFGRLMKMTQHHLSKIRGEKPGLAINLDKKLQELVSKVEGTRLPAVFTLEDQASFAIGYYHQRHHDFSVTATSKED